MITIGCQVGVMNRGAPVPPVAIFGPDAQKQIGNVFRDASGGDFSLRMFPPVLMEDPAPAGSGVTALDLHLRLSELVGSPERGPVSSVGVLLAHYYLGFEGALGVMFDRGTRTPDDPNPAGTYTNVAREGCAIFLGAIRDFRSTDRDREKETRFTTLHELGHVFNLPHSMSQTLMSTSPAGTPFEYPGIHFDDDQRRWLSQCSRSLSVAPGGSRFGAAGPGGPVDPWGHFDVPVSIDDVDRLRALELTIAIDPAEFWQWEPVELELTLAVRKGGRGSYAVPQMLDPAYGCFSIFIEDPAGERRAYRPRFRQCPHDVRIEVSRAAPYRRDINITGPGGDYTFKHAGIHRVQVEFRLSKDFVLRSNILEVYVRREPRSEGKFEKTRKLFTNKRVSTVLEFRQDLPDDKGIGLLVDHLEATKRGELRDAHARYAVGAACLVHTAGAYRRRKAKQRTLGVDLLKSALDDGVLSEIKQQAAVRRIDQASQ